MWYETLIPRLLNMTLTGSLVICIVLLCRFFLRKSPRILSYGLWAVVLFRLLCPVALSTSLSLLNLLDVPVSGSGTETSAKTSTIEYIPENIVTDPFPEVDFLVDIASDAVNSSLPQGMEQVESRPLSDLFAVAGTVWLAGTAAMLLYSLISLVRLYRVLRNRKHLWENIYISSSLSTPIVTGLFRPKIHLPEALSAEEQIHVLRHERHHIRRFDHILRPLAFVALCVHWFNPLVWLACSLSEKDMEMSCDEAVVRDMDKHERCDYSQSLLHLATGHRPTPASPLSFCEGDPAGRIKNILRWRRPSRLSWIVCICVCLLLCVSLATDPVVTVDASSYASFHGTITFGLPEGYDYFLLSEPSGQGNPDIVIYRTASSYPVCDGCISLHFSRTRYSELFSGSLDPHSETVRQTTGSTSTSYRYTGPSRLFRRILSIPDQGSLEIQTYNEIFWTDSDYIQYGTLINSITVTSYEDPVYFNLDEGGHLTAQADEIYDYFLYTSNGSFCVYLPEAQGEVSIAVFDAYTGKPIQEARFLEDASAENHCIVTGLSCRKAYRLQVTGDAGDITIFQ